MTLVFGTAAVEDPIGVIVGLITERDPLLDRAVMVRVAGDWGGVGWRGGVTSLRLH